MVPESPRWLLANDKEEEARKVVQRIASINNRTLPDDIKLAAVSASLMNFMDDAMNERGS